MNGYFIIFCISQFFLVLISAKIVGVFYEERKTSFKVMLLLLHAIFFAIIFVHLIIRNYLTNEWLIVGEFVFIAGCFVITLNYKSTIARRLAATFSTSMIIMFTTIPTIIIIHFLLPDFQTDSSEFLAVFNISIIPIWYLMATLISRFRNIRMKTFPRIAMIAPLIVAFIVIMFLGAGIAMSIFSIDIAMEVSIIFILILIAWLIFSSFFLFDILSAKYEEKLNSERQAQEKEYYYTQCQLMQESVKQVTAVRHDMKIHFATLKDFTSNGNIGDIKRYLDGLVEDIEKSEIYSNTGNIALDSIINYKLRNAKNSNIKLDLNIAIPPTLNVEVVDTVTILGNLLDNALEAVAKVNEKIIKIDIKLKKGGLFVKIENSFNGEVKYDESREESQILSLKGSNEHGYGLKNIKKSVEKYNGHMKISHTENIFSTGVFIYVSDR